MSFGVTPSGFSEKTTQDIIDELEESERAVFGPSVNTLATSVLGQLNGIFAAAIAEVWDVALAVYRSTQPDSATGEAQDNLLALTGLMRNAATKSLAEAVIVTGAAGTLLTTGQVASVEDSGDRFSSVENVTLSAATAWLPSTSYALGDIRTNSGNIYIVITAGQSAGSGGPTGTGEDITDNEVHWRFVGTGTAYGEVDFEAEQIGPINATAYTLINIETPVAGWQGVGNPTDATPGTTIETDEAARLRRERTLRAIGAGSVEAILGRLTLVDGVLEAFVFENPTNVTDGDGLPPHSFESVADGGADADIAQAIFEAKPTGIETYGTTTVPVLDSQGFSHDIKFSRPALLTLYVDVTVKVNPGAFPSDGVDLVKAALVAKGGELGIGDDVIILPIRAAPLAVPGVQDVYSMEVDTVVPPINTANIQVSNRQRASFDTARVNVVVE